MIRVILPHHLRTLARVDGEIELEVPDPPTPKTILDALETNYPTLRGTIREHDTQKRRPLVRFFACGEDISHAGANVRLPQDIAEGREPFIVMGAIAGG
jgi:hypothetical protein